MSVPFDSPTMSEFSSLSTSPQASQSNSSMTSSGVEPLPCVTAEIQSVSRIRPYLPSTVCAILALALNEDSNSRLVTSSSSSWLIDPSWTSRRSSVLTASTNCEAVIHSSCHQTTGSPATSPPHPMTMAAACAFRSEEHTSELQSLMRTSYAVCCL